jgi:hypothetical protein
MFTLLSGIFGGLLRLMPEVFKFFTAKQEMKHELDMQKCAYDFQVLKGKQETDLMVEKGAAEWNAGAMDAFKTGIEAASKPSGVKWVDGWNAMMRPLIATQWVVLLYPAVLITTFVVQIDRGADILVAMHSVFGETEKGICAFIIDFFFIGRVLEAGKKKYAGSK